MSNTSIMAHTDKCIALYNKKGNQTNEWRIEVFHAVRVEGRKVADIARLIRKEKYASEWDGIIHTDKQFKSLSRRVAEALKRVGAEFGINLDQLESMSHNRAEIFLKRKYSSMSTTRRQKIG